MIRVLSINIDFYNNYKVNRQKQWKYKPKSMHLNIGKVVNKK